MKIPHQAARAGVVRLRIVIRGAVQGVGFRPFVFRLASELGLKGWVKNSVQGVFIELEGPKAPLESFLVRLESDRPPRSFIQSLESTWLDARSFQRFEIRPSDPGGPTTALVLPDIATCPDCRGEIIDPNNRRYQYPFTNCTNCGPRFSIIEALPYDRPNTSMKAFRMCAACAAEYENPLDRRFHAQPNACPLCGPHLEFWSAEGTVLAGKADESFASESAANRRNLEALEAAVKAIRAGRIVAVKGLGGFHLMVAAVDEGAVKRLRDRKHREEKPLALMFPSLGEVKAVCEIGPNEERLLQSPEAPILLLPRRQAGASTNCLVPEAIAPGNPYLGVMLPYTPLHHLLLARLGIPVVATSGNLSDEPICIDEREALERLAGIADFFLVHNRPIVRHVDDSIVRMVAGREMMLRRARGYAPLPVRIGAAGEEGPELTPVLAVGAHLKNTVALSVGRDIFLSQHIGDLETEPAYRAFERVISDLQKLYATVPAVISADAHPEYLSTRFAREATSRPGGPSLVSVQHHLAHTLSCLAENDLAAPVLGVSWDGTGYGLDGTVWGGEFFVVTATDWQRIAHFRMFRLPGGDKAVKEPRRTALGLLFEAFGQSAFEMRHLVPLQALAPSELGSLRVMLERGLNSPLTSSAGRLFDAVAALAGLRQQVRFEGQAAMELEFALAKVQTDESYDVPTMRHSDNAAGGGPIVLDWSGMLSGLLEDIKTGVPSGTISAKFHNTLAELIVAVASRAAQERVLLSGGCFQNCYLTERTIARLRAEGFRPYWHQRVPPNDGGIALGQVVAAFRANAAAPAGAGHGAPG